jgi:CRP-like cAMP-binding protein
MMDSLPPDEKSVDLYLSRNDKEAALKLLFELTVKHAKLKDFGKAEALRNRMFEIDPFALSEIITSGEIIEEEKIQGIDHDHRNIWSRLYGGLTSDEANALFYAMKRVKFDHNQVVYEQGGGDFNLYFINEGLLKVIINQGGRETLVKKVGVGDVVGEDHFFSSSVCTTSLVTTSRADLSYLEPECLAAWKADSPVLESKLTAFISGRETISKFLQDRDLDRRASKRIILTGTALVQILNAANTPIGRAFKGDLCDISLGGLCFLMRIAKRETTRLLLGKNLRLSFVGASGETVKGLDQDGCIVAVRYNPLEDCSMHVRFKKPVTDSVIREIKGIDNHHVTLI